jgi:hypothetical protein
MSNTPNNNTPNTPNTPNNNNALFATDEQARAARFVEGAKLVIAADVAAKTLVTAAAGVFIYKSLSSGKNAD